MKKADLIILAGQSNAVGVGHEEYLPDHFPKEKVEEYKKGYETIKINYFSQNIKSNGFVNTTLCSTKQNKKLIGPELGMAEFLSSIKSESEIFIVKCAFGTTTLYCDWLSPSSGANYDALAFANQKSDIVASLDSHEELRAGWCYNELVKLTKESISLLESKGFSPRIRAFCWMQGESDANRGYVTHYSERYDNMLNDFNAEFSNYLEDCVYIDAGIGKIWNNQKHMNSLKYEYSKSHKNCIFIDTIANGLTTENEPKDNPDIAHYDSDSVIKLGWLFAENMGF